MKINEIRKQEEGTCPACGKSELEYEGVEMSGDDIYYPWTCSNCKATGEEWYKVTFSKHNNVSKGKKNTD